MGHTEDLKEVEAPELNELYLREVEAPAIDDIYLRFIHERDLAFYHKVLGDMKKKTRDLLDSGLFEKASEKLKRMIEKEKEKKKTPPGAAEEEQDQDNDDGDQTPPDAK